MYEKVHVEVLYIKKLFEEIYKHILSSRTHLILLHTIIFLYSLEIIENFFKK